MGGVIDCLFIAIAVMCTYDTVMFLLRYVKDYLVEKGRDE